MINYYHTLNLIINFSDSDFYLDFLKIIKKKFEETILIN